MFRGHPLGPFRPLGGKSRCGQKLSHGGLGFLGIEEFTVLPYTFLHSAISISADTQSIWQIVFPFTDVFDPIVSGIGALPVPFVILPFTDVFAPIGKGIGALSVVFVILPFTDVFVPIGIGIGAFTVIPPKRTSRRTCRTTRTLRQSKTLSLGGWWSFLSSYGWCDFLGIFELMVLPYACLLYTSDAADE